MSSKKPATIYPVSLGCPKNRIDSEVMLGLLSQAGYVVTERPEDADILLVNTCGFIQPAIEEAIDAILELAQYKQDSPDKILVATGCLVQRYGDELRKEFPEVDIFIGTEGFHEIIPIVEDFLTSRHGTLYLPEKPFLMDSSLPRLQTTPFHYAYLKVTEGCLNNCSYCMIPAIRGRQRSRPVDDLVKEALRLEAAGVRELILVAQDLTAYGIDINKKVRLPVLLEALIESCTIPWIRLLYLHPARITSGLLALMQSRPRLLPYIDMPMQHINTRILQAMKRGYDRSLLEKQIAAIRQNLPEAAIRTTLMVGFPGETAEDIDEMAEFMQIHQLEHVGIFSYCNEDGCQAATLPGQIDDAVKEQRKTRLLELQAEISLAKNRHKIGTEELVLVEGPSRESELLLEGRTRFQAPEIDGCVYITAGNARVGDLVRVKFTDAQPYDLVGEIIDE